MKWYIKFLLLFVPTHAGVDFEAGTITTVYTKRLFGITYVIDTVQLRAPGTVTGRYSCTGINLQSIPRDRLYNPKSNGPKTLGDSYRLEMERPFEEPRTNNLHFDFADLELRVLAQEPKSWIL